MLDAVTLGEVMAMFVATDTRRLDRVERFDVRLAGAEMNVAVGLTRLGQRVRYLGAVGDDPFGARARRVLAAEDVDGLVVDPGAPTGFQLKSRVSDGDPEVVYFRKGSAASRFEWSAEAERTVRQSRHLHVTGIFPALSESTRDCVFRAVAAAREAGATVSLDPNLRPTLWPSTAEMVRVVNALADQADTVLPGLGEGVTLTNQTDVDGIAEFYLERGVSEVVVKRGEQGGVALTRTGRWTEPALPVDVVDTVGAGDGFAAGWISARLDGADEPAALRRACAVGALATTSEGDMDGLPARDKIDAVLTAK